MYDGILKLEMSEDVSLVADADDLAVVVTRKREQGLMDTVNETPKEISKWVKKHELELASENLKLSC